MIIFFFFKQKTADEMRISDWSSDVCSSDLRTERRYPARTVGQPRRAREVMPAAMRAVVRISALAYQRFIDVECCIAQRAVQAVVPLSAGAARCFQVTFRIGPLTIKATQHGHNGQPATPLSTIRRRACSRDPPRKSVR